MFKQLSTLFAPKPLLDQSSADWIIESYGWALSHFDAHSFFNDTQLIQPTNRFFPGAVNSIHSKAENIFNHTREYCGLNQWPFKLVPPHFYEAEPPQLLGLITAQRFINPVPDQGTKTLESSNNDSAVTDSISVAQTELPIIAVSYDPNQTLKAGDLASTFAHVLAQHLAVQAQQFPPGGRDLFMEGTELLAIFMGFGVLFANSAYTFRGGCGSCYNPYANRQASLSENDVLFALAVFCHLKGIDFNSASGHLKPHLKKSLKQAFKQLDDYQDELAHLKNTYQPDTKTPLP